MSKTKRFIVFFISLVVSFSFVYCFAEDSAEDVQKQIDKYTKKLNDLEGRATTLTNEIDYMDTQINLTQLQIQNSISKIAKTEKDIAHLTSNIDDIKQRLEKLKESIAYQKKVLDARMRTRYKVQESSPVIILLGAPTINTLLQRAQYLKAMELQDNKMLDEMDKTKLAYTKQQDIFEDKKEESEQLKKNLIGEKSRLDAYKNSLADQKEDKQTLLAATQNDEQKYQKLLAEAKDRLASFGNFVNAAGGGVINSGQFGSGKKGWYMSQRDSRWANNKIGKSNYNIFNFGCLVASVAMIYKHYGQSVTPATIAADSSRYLYPTADMLIPWKGPSGRTYRAITKSQIDAELKNNPVIVGIYAGTYGTHFVVLSEKSGNDYIMYDPYYGPDLKFSSRYSTGSIFQAVVFK